MGRKHKHYGGIIGASPIDSNGALRPGVSNLGGISGDNPFEAPSLDLNFDGTASSFTRATTSPTAAKANGDQLATDIVAQNKTGTVQSKHMGANGRLINGYVTNLVDHSTDFSQWTVSNGELTTGQADPFNGNAASTFTDSNNNNTGNAYASVATTPPASVTSKTWSASVWVKKEAAAVNNGLLRLNVNNSTDRFDLQFNAYTGAFQSFNTASSPSSTSSFSADREDFGDWYRFSVSCVLATASHIQNGLYIFPAANTGTFQNSYDISLTGSITIFGAQLETTATASQYMPVGTNFVPNSIDLRQSAGWGGNLSTTTQVVSGQLDPNGGNNATTLNDDDSAGFRFLEAVTTFPSSNDYWCSSIFVKKGSGIPGDGTSEVHCLCRVIVGTPGSGNEVYHDLVLDPNTGNTSNSSALTGAIVSVQDLGGWYRMIIAGQASGADTRAAFQFFPDAGGTWVVGGTNFTASAKGSVIVFGPQLERGSSASAYSPTGDSFHVPRLEYGNLRTNLIPQSTGEDLRWPNTSWTSTNFTGPAGEWGFNHTGATLSKVAAPDGTNTAVRFNKPSTGTYSVARLFMGTTAGAYTCAAGATQTVSFWIRNRLSASGDIIMQPYADSNGHADTPLITQSDMPQNEWVRISHTFTNPTNNTPLGTNPARSSWDIEFQTNAAHDFDLWGLQLEEGSSATDYIATYDGARTVGEPLGLLVEEARTNLFSYSEPLYLATNSPGGGWTNAAGEWAAYDANDTLTSVTAPDGTNTAVRYQSGSGNGKLIRLYGVSSNTYSIANGETQTVSLWVRNRLSGSSYFSIEAYMDQINFGTVQLGNLPVNKWTRVELTYTHTGSTVSNHILDLEAENNATHDFEIWGVQLEVGAGATSYIPTSGAPATRTADDITLATSSFGYSDVAGSVLANFTLTSETSTGDYPHVWALNNSAGHSKIAAFVDETATPDNLDLMYRSYAGGANPSTYRFRGTVTQPTYGSAVALSMRYAEGNFGTALDGTLNTTPTEDTSVNAEAYTGQSRTSVELGGDAVGNAINGHIRRFTYWPRAINDASLIAYTGTTPPTIDIDRPTRRWGGMTGRSLVENRVEWTPADITSATVAGWFDGENVKGGSAGNSGATVWVNKAGGANLNFNGSPTVGTNNVRTYNSAYLGEPGTPSFLQTSDWRVFIAATINGGSGTDQYAPLFSSDTGSTNTGAFVYWKTQAQEFASYPHSNTWGFIDPIAPAYRSNFQGNPAVIDFKASASNPWEIAFDGGRSVSAVSSTYTNTIASNQAAYFGYSYTNTRRLDANYYQIVIVHGTLSADDEARLYSYLAHKAGSQSYLQDSDYSSAAPTRVVTGPTSLATTPAVLTTGVLSLAEDYQSKL